ncbi:hypothetical protein A2U01_0037060, partial [Trifolium medium]|nr:hypothetical protein [Trifolium medium]
ESELLKLPPISTRSFRIPVRVLEGGVDSTVEEVEEEEEEDEADEGGGARKLATPRKISERSSLTP